jgi:drug/metabolite transporter (DMT)-like permease
MVLFEPETLTAGIAWSQLRAQTWIALFHHIVLSQSLAYVIWYRLLSRLPAGTVSLSTLMVPAIGVVSSVLFLGETPTLADFAGLALMTAAAGAVMAPTRRPQPG